jgi:hypothetical protein
VALNGRSGRAMCALSKLTCRKVRISLIALYDTRLALSLSGRFGFVVLE